MEICKICEREFKNCRALSIHVSNKHHIYKEDYYLQYIGTVGICEVCGQKTIFKSLKSGYHRFCSTKCSANSSIVRDKIKHTCLKKYGFEISSQSDEVKKTARNNNLKKYGVVSTMQLDKFKEKYKQTCLERYGVENSGQLEEVKEKIKHTCLKKYGVDYSFQAEKVKDKIKQTMLDIYGVENASQSDEIRRSRLDVYFKSLLSSGKLLNCTPNFSINEYVGSINTVYSWTCNKCQTIFEDHIQYEHVPRCPICCPKFRSKQEIEIDDFIKSLGIKTISSSKKIIPPYELDIYIPSHNLAIEFDGLYWHSELINKNRNYHLDKTVRCQEKGVQLIHIFEDEWINHQDIVKSIITAKLGLIQNHIHSKKCIIKEVLNDDANLFLIENHLKGSINGQHFGLYHEEELISLVTIYEKSSNECNILRFCNKINTNIIDGFLNLFEYLKSSYNVIFINDDIKIPMNINYSKYNFTQLKINKPTGYYLDNNCQRIDLSQYDENVDCNRIWDCGSIDYVYNKELVNE